MIRHYRKWVVPALLILPSITLFGIVIIVSALESFWISFHDWDGLGAMSWIGIANYEELAGDPQFYVSVKNNAIWIAVSMLSIPLGLAFALLVNQDISGMRVMKSLLFMPKVLSSVTVGVVFTWFYTPNFGLLPIAGSWFGIEVPAVLSHPDLVTYAVVGAALWIQVSLNLVLFLAALSGLNGDLIGAGRVDGAKGWQMLWHVILPQLAPIAVIAVALTAISALRSFDLIAVMTAGGPFGSSTTLAFQMYEQSIFSYRFGYGAALAVVLMAITGIFIAWYLFKVLRSERTS
ncbi:sugar ABC transporter permease [Agrobacterium salinitolerans]|uniref:carbohydrate ABC transporter permease n=1 Tax=Agrobacterium salinitolerans TaxID=1183413 RepID=UPI00098F34C7|nr:sugar ABC transporter permease [Agrobacterium salinitolerans]OOO27709.1 sugar ABC transporter permease [Agrobacterium salinitolerans]PNQ25610.1 sugar ABC transporter permease [Rhizobium sp. YIC5082]